MGAQSSQIFQPPTVTYQPETYNEFFWVEEFGLKIPVVYQPLKSDNNEK